MLILIFTAALLLPAIPSPAASAAAASGAAVTGPPPTYLYKVTLMRAAPGKLLDLIEGVKEHQGVYRQQGDAAPFLMRHSQGDQWDLFLLTPMESHAAYYAPDRIRQRGPQAETRQAFREMLGTHLAWTEDLFAYGPPLDVVRAAFEGAGLFHVEMFQALPGEHARLYQEREMENAYLAALDRPQNLIFARDQGAAWDVFTIGFYRDLKHFAESVDIPLDAEQRAAKAAGFESVYTISAYLRALIQMHHDTLAVAVR